MARLRLFASAREAAGVGTTEVDGDTVAQVLEAAVSRFGADFEVILETCQVWCNGEPTQLHQEISAEDEIAILPPISGGA